MLGNKQTKILYCLFIILLLQGRVGAQNYSELEEVKQFTKRFLEEEDPNIRHIAAMILSRMEIKRESTIDFLVPVLIDALKNKNWVIRYNATSLLGKISARDKIIVPPLIDALQSDKITRAEAAALGMIGIQVKVALLGRISERHKIIVPSLIDALQSDKNTRSGAAKSLGIIGREAEDAVPSLAALINDEDNNVRRNIIWALGQIGPSAEVVIPDLIILLKHDKDEHVRLGAAETLGRIGDKAKVAVPDLIEAFQHDKSEYMKTWVISALGDIRAAEAVPFLIKALKEEPLKQIATVALGQVGPEAESAIPYLIELLKDKDTWVRSSAVGSIGRIGMKTESVILALLEVASEDANKGIREKAREVLEKLEK